MNSIKNNANSRDKLSANTVIGIAATVIALASLLLSVWEGYQTRLHNHLSVMPHLALINNFVDGEREFGILLCNKGTGPAIIRELKISIDGKPVVQDQYGGWGNARTQLGIREPWNHCSGFSGLAISAGETIPLLAIKAKDQTYERELLLRNAIARLGIMIVYESIYGEQHTVPEK